MPDLPEWLRAVIDPKDVVGALETAATYVFAAPDGARESGKVWLVHAGGRLELRAHSGLGDWRFSVEGPRDAAVETGLTRDKVKVGPYLLPLERRTGPEAARIVEVFTSAASGTDYAPPPTGAAGVAVPGAIGLPPWWLQAVGGPPEDPWLYAVTTGTTYPCFGFDGASHEVTLTLGVSARRLAVAAHLEAGRGFVAEVEGPVARIEKLGKDELHIGPWRLSAKDRDAARMVELAKASEAERLDRLLAHAMGKGAFDAVAGYVERLVGIEAATQGALRLAQIESARGRPDAALAHLALVTVAPPAARFEAELRALDKRVGSAKPEVVEALDAALTPARAAPVTPPRDFPWPPEGPRELLAAGFAVRGDPEAGAALLDDAAGPRGEHARLTLRGGAPDAWRATALAYEAAGDLTNARVLLARALELAPSAADHLQDAAWAWRADDRPGSEASFAAALGLGVELEDVERFAAQVPTLEGAASEGSGSGLLSSLGRLVGRGTAEVATDPLGAMAEVSEARASPRVAAQLLVTRALAALDDDEGLRSTATRAAEAFGAPDEAARLLEARARHLEATDEETAEVWLAAASHRARATEPDAAQDNLRSALAAEFLRPENYQAALDLDGAELPASLSGWWRHLHGVLVGGGAVGAPLGPGPELDAAALDALHPGGVGWLDKVRTAVQESTPPERGQLVRGLERISEADHELQARIVRELSEALSMPPPECFLYRGDDAYGVCAWPTEPPVMLVGFAHLEPGPRQCSPAALRFALAVELTHLAARHPLLSFETDLLGTSHSAYQALGRYAGTAETVVDLVTMLPGVDQIAKIQRVLRISRRVFTTKSTVDKIGSLASPLTKLFGRDEAGGIGRSKLEGAALQFRLHADRAALHLTGDFAAAVEAICKGSSTSLDTLAAIETDGLAAVLERGEALTPDERLRLSGLAAYAVRALPAVEAAAPEEGA